MYVGDFLITGCATVEEAVRKGRQKAYDSVKLINDTLLHYGFRLATDDLYSTVFIESVVYKYSDSGNAHAYSVTFRIERGGQDFTEEQRNLYNLLMSSLKKTMEENK